MSKRGIYSVVSTESQNVYLVDVCSVANSLIWERVAHASDSCHQYIHEMHFAYKSILVCYEETLD